ncbi:hypothetical protein CL6EHI_145460 [Entamoeba histolytica]|uniref:CRESS-DNA virus Rep endonuclease domain-containing protein n=3 Tax=Entamoeba histolytica TaxID=5759 RepID=C4M6E8_ENTH1|nr:hypothetical protein EHI_145460 [Entamoeba histolytica HM-1:IMSS]EAL47417.1 hypothetical protein EHI_145460 [Entamoeba histolytica HM-1:IMSS]EMD48957.1 replication-associated protein, putative [Entamoeba histolytica KU27]GAT97056.1 hypothetical protein CL6EHI_145460 [Entamoeba histolytica]|eukprot:XP_652803.1 hypothetical protein EHI_145460 [Entamoeba histolytica HM-1:IMSS]
MHARRFQLTLNQPQHYAAVKDALTTKPYFKYLISCREVAPTTGHEHVHIFVCFEKDVRLSVELMHGAHIEKCRGSNKQNIDYIKKHSDIIDEIGEAPKQGRAHTVRELLAIDDPGDLPYCEFATWNKVKFVDQSMTVDDVYKPDIKVFYIYGNSGIGKTKKVIELFLTI